MSKADNRHALTVVWQKSGAVAAVEDRERVVVVDLDHVNIPARIMVGTGAAIWLLIDGRRDVGSIITCVAQESDIDAETAKDGVLQFIDDLRSGALIEVAATREED